MHLRVIAILVPLSLLIGCSSNTAAMSGFGKADIAPLEAALEKQAPLQSPTSFDTLPLPG